MIHLIQCRHKMNAGWYGSMSDRNRKCRTETKKPDRSRKVEKQMRRPADELTTNLDLTVNRLKTDVDYSSNTGMMQGMTIGVNRSADTDVSNVGQIYGCRMAGNESATN